ncbi:restriction endonuclease subunit S [Lysinibacillus sp. NPDC098008]|uniref:restriction endonuclease subunit S n=1 Tax=Lysinibacillus sp. NPDC098008 TaxID=3364146 RepID=UPI0037F49364
MAKLSDIFYVESGNGLALNKFLEISRSEGGISFVSRTSKNNGVSAIVKPDLNIEPFQAGLITVALSGNSVLESCVQPFPFYTGYHVMVLVPKNELTLEEKLYYCACIKANRYKYSFGRQANRTLKNLDLPDSIPGYIYNSDIEKYSQLHQPAINNVNTPNLNTNSWKYFRYDELFELASGGGILLGKAKKNPGSTPVVSATRLNNAVAAYTAFPPAFPANSIAIIKNGVNVGQAYYQEKPFLITTDVAVLLPKFDLDKYLALFLTTVITHDSYRYNYGRKWGKSSFDKAALKLPVDSNGQIDFDFMRNYIMCLNFSKSI